LLDMLDNLREHLTNQKKGNSENETPELKKTKTWLWILIDSIIIAVMAMCAVMPEAIPDINSVWTMFKAFLIAFIFQLVVERGLKRG